MKDQFSYINASERGTQEREKRKLEAKLADALEDVKNFKVESERWRQERGDLISSYEQIKTKIQTENNVLVEKNSMLAAKCGEESDKLKKDKDEATNKLFSETHSLNEEIQKLKQELQDEKNNVLMEKTELEKEKMLANQELEFSKRELSTIMSKCELEEKERKRLEVESMEYRLQLEKHNDNIKKRGSVAEGEITIRIEEKQRLEKALQNKFEEQQKTEKRLSEEEMTRILIEKENEGLNNQLEDMKRVQETMLNTINTQLKKTEEQTEMNLKRNIEELDNKNKALQNSLEKCKVYKLLVKYATNLQCARCNKFIANAFFQDHVSSCLPLEQNPFKNANISKGDESMNIRTLSAINVSIVQTMVREYPDTKRPYTEYIIQIRTESCQWNVARKYRAFCELHNELTASYPFIKFPSTAKDIFGLSSDLSTILSSRKPTIVEERRKSLEHYQRELLKIEVIRNSPYLRSFQDMDKYYDDMNRLLQEPEENPIRNSVLKSDRSFLNALDDKNTNVCRNMEDSPNDPKMSMDSNNISLNNQQYFLRKLHKNG